MNETRDPAQQIENVRFLCSELAGENRSLPNPMKIDHTNPMQWNGSADRLFEKNRADYFSELDNMLQRLEHDHANGLPVRAFPPVRAGQKEIIPGSDSGTGNLFDANQPGPNLGKLAQHLMSNVMEPMEKNIVKDRDALKDFLKQCP